MEPESVRYGMVGGLIMTGADTPRVDSVGCVTTYRHYIIMLCVGCVTTYRHYIIMLCVGVLPHIDIILSCYVWAVLPHIDIILSCYVWAVLPHIDIILSCCMGCVIYTRRHVEISLPYQGIMYNKIHDT